MITKYGYSFNQEVLISEKKRLINQLWKLIPMKENQEPWENQLESVIEEISGLSQIFSSNFLILLAKLEGLRNPNLSFYAYRKVIFESIDLLCEVMPNDDK